MEEQPLNEPVPAREESIFNEADFSMDGYDKHVRNARNGIFIVAAIQFIFGLVIGFTGPVESRIASIVIALIVSLIFLGLGFWSKKKPYTAILVALIVYGSLLLTDAIYDPTTIYKGILIKICIIITLVRGMQNAREAQRWKDALGH